VSVTEIFGNPFVLFGNGPCDDETLISVNPHRPVRASSSIPQVSETSVRLLIRTIIAGFARQSCLSTLVPSEVGPPLSIVWNLTTPFGFHGCGT
jgi:hypothetical protein